jgi:hypothetical protein
MAAHRLADVTVGADAGMISAANKKVIEAAGLSFILGMKIPDITYVVAQWRREHPGEQMPDGLILTQPWPAGPADQRRDQVIYYQYETDRARRTLRGIDEQVAKVERAVAGKVPVKRNGSSSWSARQGGQPHAGGQSAGAGRDQGLCRRRARASRRCATRVPTPWQVWHDRQVAPRVTPDPRRVASTEGRRARR